MRPIEWVTLLLERHNLTKPDGRPLYQYRITDSEYSELRKLLKFSAMMGVNNIRKMLFWDAAFVIYGSEWWRRYYNGQWGWDGIFESIDIDVNELPVVKRNDLIETGLQRWRRSVRYHSGKRMFLGTIATEGGLPLSQLSGSGGWLKHILQPVLRKHISRGIAISALIDGYSEGIPNSYQTSEMRQILADIAEIVVKLRQEHKLTQKEAPLKWLDSNQPNWRELFPLPIDDESGRLLLKDLVDTVLTTEDDNQNKNPFEVDRFLIRTQTPSPELIAYLELPTFVQLNELGLENSETNIPTTFKVEVFEPNGSVWPWCRGLLTRYKEKNAIKFSGRSLKLSGEDAAKELCLRFIYLGEVVYEQELINGTFLDCNLPWLFREVDGKWILNGTASQSIKNKQALVYIPDQYNYKKEDDLTEVSITGNMFDGKLFSLNGTVQCFKDDTKYKLSAGKEEYLHHYELSGVRYPYHSIPGQVFIGIPDLIETDLTTGVKITKHNSNLFARAVGMKTDWQPISQVKMGYYEVRLCDEDGYIKLSKRIGILDRNFTFKIRPDLNQVLSGTVYLEQVKNCQLNVVDTVNKISAYVEQSNSSAEIKLAVKNSPPLFVEVSLLPDGHKRDLLLNFPFPSKGALLFDKNNIQIPFSTQLYRSDLRGYRIRIFDNKYSKINQVDIMFSLFDPDVTPDELRDLYIQRRISLKGRGFRIFGLYNWIESIDSLMSISTSLDAIVRVSIILHGQEVFRLDIRRYKNEIIPKWDEGTVEFDTQTIKQISSEDLEKICISTLYLNQPEQNNSDLEPINTEQIHTGRWLFAPENRQDGSWLIYPHKDTGIDFRPILWNVGISENLDVFDIEDYDSLPKAICVPDQALRNKAIRHVLNLMASDLDHKSWEYLTNLWKKTNHLPMATFDVWKIAVNETGFLACLLIKDNDDIIAKLEEELPLIWELVYLNDWQNAIQLYKDRIYEYLKDDKELMEDIIRNKIQKIKSLGLSMISIAQILRINFPDEKILENNTMKQKRTDFLKYFIDSEYQSLLHRQLNFKWPKLLRILINNKLQELPTIYSQLFKIHNKYHQSVVYLPLILAFRALSERPDNWPSNSTELFKIQELIRFDEEWFGTVFQLLSGWITQQKNMENS